MSQSIFLTKEDIDKLIKLADAKLSGIKHTLLQKRFQSDLDREMTLKLNVDNTRDDRTANLEFTSTAWIKMRALVDAFDTEVQWHATVKRKNKHTFVVKDILIYPHSATAVTVDVDQEEYNKWLTSLDEDTFEACRFHGHSHVNMGVNPSQKDVSYRRKVLNILGNPTKNTDLFYIFVIINKRGELNAQIFDLQNNVMYSDDEITVTVNIGGNDSLDEFIRKAKSYVTIVTPTAYRSPHTRRDYDSLDYPDWMYDNTDDDEGDYLIPQEAFTDESD